jgi:hypothetical protein
MTASQLTFFRAAMTAALLVAATTAFAGDRVPATVTATSLDGGDPITLPLRKDRRGDDEVWIPNRGWTRCVFHSCVYTVRRYHFHFRETQRRDGYVGRGLLGALLGIE